MKEYSEDVHSQTRVALDRIASFLDEDEVTEQVSTLKKAEQTIPSIVPEEDGLGIEHASFKWNELEPKESTKTDNAKSSSGSEDTSTSAEDSPEPVDHKFSLKDISIQFPEGELTLITGPTASGKTALLVSACSFL